MVAAGAFFGSSTSGLGVLSHDTVLGFGGSGSVKVTFEAAAAAAADSDKEEEESPKLR